MAPTISRESELRAARLNLSQLKLQEKLLKAQIKDIVVEVRSAQNERWDVQFAQEDLQREEHALVAVQRSLQQLEYEAKNGARIAIIAEAKPAKIPSSNNRLKAMAAAPVVMLLLACGLFVLVEVKSGRVADPDELSQRVRVGVIGVVPPLPSLGGRSSRR